VDVVGLQARGHAHLLGQLLVAAHHRADGVGQLVLLFLQRRGFGVKGLVVLLELGNVVVFLAQLAFQVQGALLEQVLLGNGKADGLEGAQLQQVGFDAGNFGFERVVAQAQGLQLLALPLKISL